MTTTLYIYRERDRGKVCNMRDKHE